MKSTRLFAALGNIDDRFISEDAETYDTFGSAKGSAAGIATISATGIAKGSAAGIATGSAAGIATRIASGTASESATGRASGNATGSASGSASGGASGSAKGKRFSPMLKAAASIAACVIVAVVIFGPANLPAAPGSDSSPMTTPPAESGAGAAESGTGAPPADRDEPVVISGLIEGGHSPVILLGENGEHGELNFIQVDNMVGGLRPAPPFIDPETTYSEIWGLEQLIDFLGREFRPRNVPNDLIEMNDPAWEVIFNNDGTMIPFSNSFTLTYSESFDEEYDPLRRVLDIQVAKDSLPFRCALYMTDTETPSNIGGLEIVVGYLQMGYGPYTVTPDGQDNTPAGYYDVYIAEFMCDGIGFFVEGLNLTQEEFVEVLLSIVT